MKRKAHKPNKKRPTKRAHHHLYKGEAKPSLTTKKPRRRRYSEPKNERQTLVHQKALAALARMRRENISLSKATQLEHIKPSTFLRHVGSAVHRDGPGKPWKARKSDSLKARMRILTPKGPVFDAVRGSRERTRLALYEIVLRKFRAGEDGAEEELSAFQGLTVGGHVLVTDVDQLIQLEEAGQLDFDNLYFSVGGGS